MARTTESERLKPKQQRSKQRVDSIVDAAKQLLLEVGVEGVTTSAIAARAEVPIGSVYRYFADVDDVIAAVIERTMKEIEHATALAMLKLDTVTLRGILRIYTLTHLTYHQANPAFARVWFGGGFSLPVLERAREADFRSVDRMMKAAEASGMVMDAGPDHGPRLIMRLGSRTLEYVFTEPLSAADQKSLVLEYVEMASDYIDRYVNNAAREGVPAERFIAGLAEWLGDEPA
ncbi:MAG: TetR/AcrR family transcriptional regulator [Thermoleophilaceae bacterium]|nr:TetR/AcrR family transcriptional regulator [Thermoleophilaceae bacterium]